MPRSHAAAYEKGRGTRFKAGDIALLEGLVATGFHGATVAGAARAAFLRWYDQNRLATRYARVEVRH